MKYLDFHQHYGCMEFISPGYKNINILPDNNIDKIYEKIILDNCKQLDMVVAVNGYGFYKGSTLIKRNDEVERFFKENPDNIIGIGYVDLDCDEPGCIDDLYKRGFRGIKVIWPSERYDSKKYFNIYSNCEYHSLPVLFHTGICDYATFPGKEGACSYNMSPVFLEGIALKFPKLQIVGAHLGTGYYDVTCALIESRDCNINNIKFDISTSDHYRKKIKTAGYIKNDIPVSNLLWGLDYPPTRYKEHIDEWNEYFDDIGLTKEEKDMIFFKNACDVLGIDNR